MRLVSLASVVSVVVVSTLSIVGCAANPGDEEVPGVDSATTSSTTTPQATTGASSGDLGGGGTIGTSSSGGYSEKSKQQQMVACFNNCTKNHTGNWCVDYCDCIVYQGKHPITCEMQNRFIDL